MGIGRIRSTEDKLMEDGDLGEGDHSKARLKTKCVSSCDSFMWHVKETNRREGYGIQMDPNTSIIFRSHLRTVNQVKVSNQL